MTTSIEKNARQMLTALGTFENAPNDPERGQYEFKGKQLETVTGLSGSALRDAADFLEHRGLIKRQRFLGNAIGLVQLNAEGRVEAERWAEETGDSTAGTPAKAPVPTALEVRREILEELCRSNVESPSATVMWRSKRGDPASDARVREAEYLLDHGLATGSVGADGYVALRLSADGRDFVEGGGVEAKPANIRQSSEELSTDAEHQLPRMEVTYAGKIGQGAFGSVWRATDALLERDIAVKFLTSTDQAMDEGALIREARSVAKLSHPNLVTIHAAAWLRHPETRLLAPAITMELLQGVTLDEWWSDHRPREDMLRVASGLVAGILATHAAGLVHGDIHQGNVMVLSDATVKLIDWRYHDTFIQRSTSHRRDEMAAEERRVIDRLDILFSKQGMEAERQTLRGQDNLLSIAATLEVLTTPRAT